MDKNKIKIPQKGDDGYEVISARIKEKTLEDIEDISTQSNRSRNEVIHILLENAVKDAEIEDAM